MSRSVTLMLPLVSSIFLILIVIIIVLIIIFILQLYKPKYDLDVGSCESHHHCFVFIFNVILNIDIIMAETQKVKTFRSAVFHAQKLSGQSA